MGMGRLGGEIILLNCCKRLQINRTFFQVVTVLSEGQFSAGQPMSEESPSLPPRLRLYRFALQLILQHRLKGHPAKPSPTIESGCGGLPPALPQAPVMRAGEVCHILPQGPHLSAPDSSLLGPSGSAGMPFLIRSPTPANCNAFAFCVLPSSFFLPSAFHPQAVGLGQMTSIG
jgi:hypothetical protein